MLKKTITYEDYEGVVRTEDHYFNLTEAELTMIEMSESGGYQKKLEEIIQMRNAPAYIDILRNLVKASYGKKSPDGRRFMKSEEIYQEFSETEAYSQFFMDLCTSDDAGMAFILGILPKTLSTQVEKKMKEDYPEMIESANASSEAN